MIAERVPIRVASPEDWAHIEEMQRTHIAGINRMRVEAGKAPLQRWSFPGPNDAVWLVGEIHGVAAAIGWYDNLDNESRHITLLWHPNRYGKLAAGMLTDYALHDADALGLKVWFNTHPDASTGFKNVFEAKGFELVGLEYERPVGGHHVRR